MNPTEKRINKDLILRERLAIERTDMAIDRTLLSFIRTALYFAIAGMTVNSLFNVNYGLWVEILFWILSLIILVVGIIKFKPMPWFVSPRTKILCTNSDWQRVTKTQPRSRIHLKKYLRLHPLRRSIHQGLPQVQSKELRTITRYRKGAM